MKRLIGALIEHDGKLAVIIPLSSIEALTDLEDFKCLEAIQDLYIEIIQQANGVQ